MEGHWKFLGGEGVLEAKILEVKYEAKLEFPEVGGGAKQKPSVGGAWIFSGTTQICEPEGRSLGLGFDRKSWSLIFKQGT